MADDIAPILDDSMILDFFGFDFHYQGKSVCIFVAGSIC
jgi:hypothetical protein